MRPVLRSLEQPFPVAPGEAEQRDLLLAACDSYCLFCETPLRNDVGVTQRLTVPSGPIRLPGEWAAHSPRFDQRIRLFWGGLMLCCSACKEAKGGAPDFNEAISAAAPAQLTAILGKPGPLVRQLDDLLSDALYQIAAAAWIWPDSAEDGTEESRIGFRGDDVWNLIEVRRWEASQAELAELEVLELAPADEDEEWATKLNEMPWIHPRDNLPEPDRTRALATIRGLKLNSLDPENPGDRRVLAREHAWQTAGKALARLETIAGGLNGDGLVHLALGPFAGAVRGALRATGYWRVWAERFVSRLKSGEGPWSGFDALDVDALLTSLLVQYETPSRAPFGAQAPSEGEDDDVAFTMVIDGTDVARLPPALGGRARP